MHRQTEPTPIKEIPLEYMSNQQLREALCEAAMKCVNALSAYARAKGDEILLHQTGFVHSTLKRLKKEELESVCQMIHDEAAKQIQEAGAFGYSMEDVKALEIKIQAFRSLADRRTQVLKSKQNIDDVMKEFSVRRRRAA